MNPGIVARLVLHQAEWDWDRLKAIESALTTCFPRTTLFIGNLGETAPHTVEGLREAGTDPADVREFDIFSVAEERPPSFLSDFKRNPLAQFDVYYPEPSTEELSRITQCLHKAWPSDQYLVEYGTTTIPGREHSGSHNQLMQFLVRPRPDGEVEN